MVSEVVRVEHGDRVYDASFSPDGSYIASRSWDDTARVTRVSDGSEVVRVEHGDRVYDASFSPDGSYIVSSSRDGTARVTRVSDGVRSGACGAWWLGSTGASFSPDGRYIVSSSDDGTARVTQLFTSGKVHNGPIRKIQFNATGDTLFVNSGIFDPRNTHREISLIDSDPSEQSITILGTMGLEDIASARYAILRSYADRVEITQPGKRDSARSIPLYNNNVEAQTINKPGTHAAVGLSDGTVMILSDLAKADTLLITRDTLDATIEEIRFSPDDSRLAIRDATGAIQIRSTASSRLLTVQNWGTQNWIPAALALLSILIVLALLTLYWRREARPYLVHRQTQHEPASLEHLVVQGIDEALYNVLPLYRIAQRFRRRIAVPDARLDPVATVHQSIQQGGLFSPVSGTRRVAPQYLVLVDRNTFGDHQAQFVDDFLNRLVDEEVFITRYYFNKDPRVCFPESSAASPQTLRELTAIYPHHRLLVFTEGAGFFSPLTGDLQTWTDLFHVWLQRFMVTPEPPAQWHTREHLLLEEFDLVPGTPEGLAELTSQRPYNWVKEASKRSSFPAGLRERPQLWLENKPPSEAQATEMVQAVKTYLGEQGYLWFSACAVYPEIQWRLTLNLGLLLGQTQREPILTPTNLAALSRLPWFRYSFMPDWLRIQLIIELDREDKARIYEAYDLMTINRVKGIMEQSDLSVALPDRKTLRRLAREVIYLASKKHAEDPLIKDYVFLHFMLAKNVEPLAMRLPRAFRLLYGKRPPHLFLLQDARRVRNGLVLALLGMVLLIGASTAGWQRIPLSALPVELVSVIPPPDQDEVDAITPPEALYFAVLGSYGPSQEDLAFAFADSIESRAARAGYSFNTRVFKTVISNNYAVTLGSGVPDLEEANERVELARNQEWANDAFVQIDRDWVEVVK